MIKSFSTLPASHRLFHVSPQRIWTRSKAFLTDTTVTTSGPEEVPTLRHQVLTLLHKTVSLLPRTLVRQEFATNPSESLEFWNEVLAVTYDDLTQTGERNARIVIYGVDKWSGARETVTALLHKPFTSDDSQNISPKNRWSGHDRPSLTIKHTASLTAEADTLGISSPYLNQFAVPIQITELNSSSALRDEKAALALFKADISVIVWNPLTTPLTVLLTSIAALNNPNTLLAITSSSSTTQLHAHIESLIQQHLDEVKTIFIDPWRALRAHEILESDSASPLSVQRFQDDFTESRISSISDFLNDIFAQVDPIHTSTNHTIMTSNAFGTYAALSRIRSALVMCQKSLRDSERKMDIVRTSVSNLRMQIEEVKMKAHRKVLGISGEVVGASRAEDMDEVGKALNDTEKKLKEVLDWLTWWRMLWRVDEIGIIVGDAVDKAWCNDLEKKLIMQTGRLFALQQKFTRSTFALFPPLRPPSSPLLLNTLHQLSSSPSYSLTPVTLTAPLQTRHTQLKYPNTRLHLAGQKVALGLGGGVVAGVGVGWAGWVGLLMGPGEGISGYLGMEAETAVAVGMLGALLSVRWAVGKWEKAKKRWLEDWRRVGDGLGRDLKKTLDQTMEDNVVVVAERASSGLEDWVAKRKEEVEELREELLKLEDAVSEVQCRMRR